jgi:hypothetical protein
VHPTVHLGLGPAAGVVRRLLAAVAVGAACLLPFGVPAASGTAESAGAGQATHLHGHHVAPEELGAARAATARFHRLSVAEDAGYARLPAPAPLHECIDEDVDLHDRDGKPAMGIHWVNGSLLDGTVDARTPEVLVYEPSRNGKLHLVALEYVVFESAWGAPGTRPAPRLFGEDFMYVASPNRYGLPAFYALHAWVWKANPAGALAPMNPRVSCRWAGAVDAS